MGMKHHKPGAIVQRLRHVEIRIGVGTVRLDAIREIGITNRTDFRCRKKDGGMGIEQLNELKRLQKENECRGEAVSDVTLCKWSLAEAAKGISWIPLAARGVLIRYVAGWRYWNVGVVASLANIEDEQLS